MFHVYSNFSKTRGQAAGGLPHSSQIQHVSAPQPIASLLQYNLEADGQHSTAAFLRWDCLDIS